MSSTDSSHPSDPSAPASAIELETVTALKVEEDTEDTEAERNKESNSEAKPTSELNIELILNPKS